MGRKVVVSNLSRDVKRSDLKDHFERCGRIVDVWKYEREAIIVRFRTFWTEEPGFKLKFLTFWTFSSDLGALDRNLALDGVLTTGIRFFKRG